jgi:hypothetical protein
VLKSATIATRQESESDLQLGATSMQPEISSAVEIHSCLQVITRVLFNDALKPTAVCTSTSYQQDPSKHQYYLAEYLFSFFFPFFLIRTSST